jgi:hypothetical protein
MAASGSVIVNLAAGAARDAAGNLSQASTSADNEVLYQMTSTDTWLLDFDAGSGLTAPGYMGVRPKPAGPITIQRLEPAGSGPLDADGSSTDAFQGTGAPANSFVTVATTLGTAPADQDRDTMLQGVQVLADEEGEFTFQIKRPSGTGGSGNATAMITAQEVLGRNLGATTQEYQPSQSAETVLRFDLGASAAYTQSGFTFVGPRDLYSGTRGYGWSVRVAAADRPYQGWSNLNRDLHTGSNATFRVQVGAGGTYNVRVYLANPLGTGGYQYTYDNFEVRVEGGSTYPVALLAPGLVTIADLTGSPGADNILDIQFIDLGGQNFNWVVSGIEVTSGSLGTAVQPLLADEAASGALGGGLTISDATLAPLVAEAAARWSAVGLTAAQAAVLSDLHVGVADLGGAYLGLAVPTTNEIRLDDDAAGFGWSVVSGPLSVVSSPWSAISDQWPVISDQWPVVGDRWGDRGPQTTDNGQRTTDNEQRTKDNEQRTKDNGRRTTDTERRGFADGGDARGGASAGVRACCGRLDGAGVGGGAE